MENETNPMPEKLRSITQEVAIKRLTEAGVSDVVDVLIREATLRVTLIRDAETGRAPRDGHTLERQSDRDSSHQFALCADRIDDFLVGWLRSSGLIQTYGDLLDLTIEEAAKDVWRASVHLAAKAQPVSRINEAMPALPLPASWFFAAFDQQDADGHLFKLTGSSHVLGLYDWQGAQLDLVEDISRHVAFDKLIGRAVKNDLDLTQCLVLTSCRLTGSIVLKGIAVGLPLLASRGAVSSRALQLAQKHKVRLLGFVRGGRMNVYGS